MSRQVHGQQALVVGSLVVCLLAAGARAQIAPGGQSQAALADTLVAAFADTAMGAFADTTLAALADTVSVDSLAKRLAAVDEVLAAFEDSLAAEGRPPALIESLVRNRRQRLYREANEAHAVASGETLPLFSNCTNTPEVGVKADVTKVNYYSKWTNSVTARKGGSVNNNFGITYDSYRRQDKTVEARNASVDYASGQLLPVVVSAHARIDWSEDITTNAGGNTNVNRRKSRRAGLGLSRHQIRTGAVSHNVMTGAFYNDQNAVNQQQQNDFNEGELNGALRSGMSVVEGVNLATRIYGIWRDGQSNLANFESPSSTTGDSLGAGAYYKRRLLQGAVVATQSSFDKRYLDYRRNSNGLIDTTEGNLPPGARKVVQELEEQDALDLKWDNILAVGSVQLISKLTHTFDRQQYRESAVGRKDRSEDLVELKLTVPAGADSFAVFYKYHLKWDDQRIAGAASNRGRQNNKIREFTLDWFREIFSRTSLSARFRTELSQDIAEIVEGEPFNENDRDRLTQELRLRMEAAWPERFSVSLLGEYQEIQDISIRATRSANNNTKETYEIAPSYTLVLGPDLSLSQTFRMYIQYQNYAFVGLEGVNKEDGFNKRGNLNTELSWKPSDRLTVDVKHDYNQKYNGTRTRRDATGSAFYRRDQDQSINRIELGMTWKAADWLNVSTATYRTKDIVTRFGTTDTEDTRYSGELWLGGVIKHSWGPQDRPFVLDAAIRRYLAYGPNVTDTSDDYWRADVLVKWTF